jgi:hypothetical protein
MGKILRRSLWLLIAASCLLPGAAAMQEKNSEAARLSAALRVEELLAGIEKRASEPGRRGSEAVVSEGDFNAFIARRLEQEKDKYVKGLMLKLKPRNKVEGRLVLDLSSIPALKGLAGLQEVLFNASFQTKEGKIRIKMEKLMVGMQELSPLFLDVVIGLASKLEGYEPVRLSDWHDLPKGVKGLESRSGCLIVRY